MTTNFKIGIISDLDDQRASQLMTDTALLHTAEHFSIEIQQTWLTTTKLAGLDFMDNALKDFHGIWAGPGDYEHPEAAIEAIRYCREKGKPFFGT